MWYGIMILVFASIPSFSGVTCTPFSASMSISSTRIFGFMTVPGPMRSLASNSTPDGTLWSLYVFPSATTVWPALSPPWNRTTISYFSASMSTSFPFPSSPNWAPVIIVNMLYHRLVVGKSDKFTFCDLSFED